MRTMALMAWWCFALLGAEPANAAAGNLFRWEPRLSSEGPVVVVVRLDGQTLSAFRNGVAIGWSRISSGRSGYDTPAGTFRVLQKDADHRSNRYDDAPMPHMLRLTWDGVALHGGSLPGHPASHGCIRLPPAFAASLFEAVDVGDVVVVLREGADAASGSLVSPFTASGTPQPLPRLDGDGAYWDDFVQPVGVVTIVASIADRRAQVLRNGVRVAESSLRIGGGSGLPGTAVYRRYGQFPGEWTLEWTTAFDAAKVTSHRAEFEFLQSGPQFSRRINDLIQAGTTLVVTGESADFYDDHGAERTVSQPLAPEAASADRARDRHARIGALRLVPAR